MPGERRPKQDPHARPSAQPDGEDLSEQGDENRLGQGQGSGRKREPRDRTRGSPPQPAPDPRAAEDGRDAEDRRRR